SVFAGAFSLEAATALLADQAGAGGDVIDQVASLVEKSLLTVLHLDAGTRYRMLETTRSYAQEKLVQRGEMDCYSRRHAEHLRSVLKRAAKDWETLPEAEWAAAYCALIDDARVTLNWALTRSNDPALAAELAVAMVPLWLQRSHLVEWRTQVERALAMVLAQEGDAGSRHEMQLRAALGGVLHSIGGASAASDAELRRALELAESLGDSDHQLMTVMGLTVCRIIAGDCRAALPLARQYCALVESRGRPAEQFQSHNFMSYLLSWMGDQAGARRFCDLYKARPPSLVHRISTMGHQYDHRNTTLGRVLWLEGHAEQALRFASDSLEEVLAAGHPHAICALLATMACPIALLSGRLDDAERYARLLQERALKSGLSNFPAWGRGLEAAVQIERGVFEPATSVLAAAVEQLRRANIVVFGAILVAALAKGLQGSGRITEALSVLDDAIEQAERMEARWYLPEQWRIKGELLLAEGRTDAARRADEWFGKSLELSRSQGSLSWELRTAMSRARLLWKQEQPECASQLLQSVMARFTEGWDTADLVAAAALMESLQTRTRIRRP
ncbi:MAG: hypothetical protein OSA97_19415, partial [Nevskia sp.]|nr:hypothetical protein [Nevskia sp.]